MWGPDEPSRACATCWYPGPLAIRTQNVTELSTSGWARPLTATWNWPLAFDMRNP